MTSESGTRRIDVDYLARVEGEGSMTVKVVDGVIEDVQFGIFEPPRFFEAFMRGRMFTEAPDITARICGICPIAYQMSSVHAMEDVLGVTVDGQLRALRRLIYCGEWIESHALHVYMLHAPDFLGYQSAIHMAADHRDIVEQGLRLKKAGNTIVTVLGGREIHPINVRVGGFYRAPDKAELRRARRTSSSGPGTLRWRPCVGSRSCRRRRSRWISSSYRCLTRTSTRSTRAGSSPTKGSTSRLPEFNDVLRGGARRPIQRPALEDQGARRLPRRSARPLQPQLREATPARQECRARSRAWTVLRQPVPEHRGPVGRDPACVRGGTGHHRRLRAS